MLAERGIECTVLDLRSASPLDRRAIVDVAQLTGHVVAVDEDYISAGLTGEIAAVLGENASRAQFARVATMDALPYSRTQEDGALPNVQRIIAAVERILSGNLEPAPGSVDGRVALGVVPESGR